MISTISTISSTTSSMTSSSTTSSSSTISSTILSTTSSSSTSSSMTITIGSSIFTFFTVFSIFILGGCRIFGRSSSSGICVKSMTSFWGSSSTSSFSSSSSWEIFRSLYLASDLHFFNFFVNFWIFISFL